jgi:molybdopterin-guanine dinucleotide biosynthesis protein A
MAVAIYGRRAPRASTTTGDLPDYPSDNVAEAGHTARMGTPETGRDRTAYDALVLAGGAARRLGGADKPALRIGGATLLDRVLAACPHAGRAVVVGPTRPTVRAGVLWAREDPPGGGPVAALAAGLPHTTAPVVLLLAADLPFLDAATVDRLVAAVSRDRDRDRDGDRDREGNGENDRDGRVTEPAEAAVLVDADGHDQPLAGAYRVTALRRALGRLAAEHGGQLAGLPLRRLAAALRTVRLPDPAGASYDVDTWEEVAAARSRQGR